eukprot:TRINITY_DN5272_c0_g1_i3.p1 TRINITY_DN5272_c0_g1~~TRINITY_DN5272_c0_g1_i3.p1  ORF type:complete len:1129 (+),score=377.99 TRINITY_DN5272_c0_g1_i3:249-3635(+)
MASFDAAADAVDVVVLGSGAACAAVLDTLQPLLRQRGTRVVHIADDAAAPHLAVRGYRWTELIVGDVDLIDANAKTVYVAGHGAVPYTALVVCTEKDWCLKAIPAEVREGQDMVLNLNDVMDAGTGFGGTLGNMLALRKSAATERVAAENRRRFEHLTEQVDAPGGGAAGAAIYHADASDDDDGGGGDGEEIELLLRPVVNVVCYIPEKRNRHVEAYFRGLARDESPAALDGAAAASPPAFLSAGSGSALPTSRLKNKPAKPPATAAAASPCGRPRSATDELMDACFLPGSWPRYEIIRAALYPAITTVALDGVSLADPAHFALLASILTLEAVSMRGCRLGRPSPPHRHRPAAWVSAGLTELLMTGESALSLTSLDLSDNDLNCLPDAAECMRVLGASLGLRKLALSDAGLTSALLGALKFAPRGEGGAPPAHLAADAPYLTHLDLSRNVGVDGGGVAALLSGSGLAWGRVELLDLSGCGVAELVWPAGVAAGALRELRLDHTPLRRVGIPKGVVLPGLRTLSLHGAAMHPTALAEEVLDGVLRFAPNLSQLDVVCWQAGGGGDAAASGPDREIGRVEINGVTAAFSTYLAVRLSVLCTHHPSLEQVAVLLPRSAMELHVPILAYEDRYAMRINEDPIDADGAPLGRAPTAPPDDAGVCLALPGGGAPPPRSPRAPAAPFFELTLYRDAGGGAPEAAAAAPPANFYPTERVGAASGMPGASSPYQLFWAVLAYYVPSWFAEAPLPDPTGSVAIAHYTARASRRAHRQHSTLHAEYLRDSARRRSSCVVDPFVAKQARAPSGAPPPPLAAQLGPPGGLPITLRRQPSFTPPHRARASRAASCAGDTGDPPEMAPPAVAFHLVSSNPALALSILWSLQRELDPAAPTALEPVEPGGVPAPRLGKVIEGGGFDASLAAVGAASHPRRYRSLRVGALALSLYEAGKAVPDADVVLVAPKHSKAPPMRHGTAYYPAQALTVSAATGLVELAGAPVDGVYALGLCADTESPLCVTDVQRRRGGGPDVLRAAQGVLVGTALLRRYDRQPLHRLAAAPPPDFAAALLRHLKVAAAAVPAAEYLEARRIPLVVEELLRDLAEAGEDAPACPAARVDRAMRLLKAMERKRWFTAGVP